MRLTRTIGGWVREGSTWLVVLALVLGVVLPAACIIWFMTAAASNEADAARQRLSDALRGQLQLLSERIDADWRSRLARLKATGGNGAQAFHRAVASGGLDSIVFFPGNGVAGYPIVVAPEQKAGAADASEAWNTAAALEATGNYAAAATQYAEIAARERGADRAARAAQAHIRALGKARDTSAALEAIDRYSRMERVAAGRDSYGRLIAANERLLALRLLSSSDARFQPAAEALAALVNDYDTVVMPSSQRLFLMGELHAVVAGLSLPTYAAEQLAAEFLEADASAPAGETLESTRVRDVWKLGVGPHTVALFRTATVTAMADAILNGQRVANGATFALTQPGRDHAGETMPAGPLLPGWQLRVSDGGSDRAERTTNQRMTTYLSAGSLAVAGLAVAGLLLWQAFRRQMRVSRLKTDLVAAVSHELRTPLTSARALVDLLLENPAIDGQTREYLLMIAGENARLSRLIEHVLTFARVDRNRHGLVFRDVLPAAVVEEAAAIQGRERFPGLTVDVAPDLAPLYGDQDALVTVLLNLLENAYKYSGDDRRVSLRARQEHTRVVLEVQDNGIGIERRDWKRIFRPFYQVDQRLARERGGCGLGLSIVEFIVRAHGGEVTVESEPGAGSVFRVALPSRMAPREAVA
jgi:signal transduction histidine kinase